MESAAEYLPQARWQRCMVHFYRNVFSHVPEAQSCNCTENGPSLPSSDEEPLK
jgi:transposase-like protein